MRGEVQRVEAILHPDDQHGVGVAVADPSKGFPDRDRSTRAGRGDRMGLTEECVPSAEHAGDRIRRSVHREPRRHPTRPVVPQRARGSHGRIYRPGTGRDDHLRDIRLPRLPLDARVGECFIGGGDRPQLHRGEVPGERCRQIDRGGEAVHHSADLHRA